MHQLKLRSLSACATSLFALLAASTASAVVVEVQLPCADSLRVAAEAPPSASVGQATVAVLRDAKIPFQGDESGLAAIDGSPTGAAALEVVSDTVLRAYGWCYEVDGVQPDAMPDDYPLTGEEQVIRWFFAYSTYDSGTWTGYCTPTAVTKPDFICASR